MRISLITPPSKNIEPWVPVFESKGVIVHLNAIHPECDFIINTTQATVGLLDIFHRTYPHIPLISYVLDFYKTVWTAPNPHGYDWKKYKEYLLKSTELWCISSEVILRMEEEGMDANKCKFMKIWARFFDYKGQVVDKRYILNPLRPYVFDKNFGWLKKACKELDIPLFESKNGMPTSVFQKAIAECSFMCCEYHEMSTGGLTLLEGHRLGKVSVLSDSPYQGGRDYLGDRAIYFNDNNYEDFKNTIKEVWENTPTLNRKDCEQYCDNHPSIEDTVDIMIERLECLIRVG